MANYPKSPLLLFSSYGYYLHHHIYWEENSASVSMVRYSTYHCCQTLCSTYVTGCMVCMEILHTFGQPQKTVVCC